MKYIISSMIIAVSFWATAQNKFEIVGKSTNNELNGQRIYLLIEDNYSANSYSYKDSTTISNGTFSLLVIYANQLNKPEFTR